MKRKPTGFIAACQCGAITGAMDFTRTERPDAGKILGRWLTDGCTITPQFAEAWVTTVSPCECKVGQAQSCE